MYNLAGGIKAWQTGLASGPPEAGMELITGKETGAEMLEIVYGMEEGMRSFFEQLSERVSDADASELFRTLSELEVHHKNAIFELYRKQGGACETVAAMDERVSSGVMEGGMSTEALVESSKPDVHSVEDVLGFAMMLETQALDLYLRYWKRSEDLSTQAVLIDLTEQEKSHLAYLGALLEEKTARS